MVLDFIDVSNICKVYPVKATYLSFLEKPLVVAVNLFVYSSNKDKSEREVNNFKRETITGSHFG